MPETMQMKSAPAAILEFSSRAQWPLAKRTAFRFFAAYFILFNLPYQGHVNLLGAIPGLSWLAQAYIRGSRRAIEWVAAHVFHLAGDVAVYPRVNGSGDTTLVTSTNSCW